MNRVGIDAHKKSCNVCVFKEDAVGTIALSESFMFRTTPQGIAQFMSRIPENSVVVVESSTTGKVMSRALSPKYEVHMIAPPERKPSIKTNKRDAEKIVREDMLGYSRRCYIPSPYIENMRFLVAQQMELGKKISMVKSQIHALLERNMLQSVFEDLSDIFGVEGLERLSSLKLPYHDKVALAMRLEELRLYVKQHAQTETEIARVAQSDEDCQDLMSIPGIGQFAAVAIKARVGDDATRFPTKKHLCSYAGVVPGADNTGEYVSEHNHVKRGDTVLKYALTCGARGAVAAKTDSAVKHLYLRKVAKGMPEQKAEVAAARKLACIVWKVLTSKRRYVEEDRELTRKKVAQTRVRAKRVIHEATSPESIPSIIKDIAPHAEVLAMYPEDSHVSECDVRGPGAKDRPILKGGAKR